MRPWITIGFHYDCHPEITKGMMMAEWKALGFTISPCEGFEDDGYQTPEYDQHNAALAKSLLKTDKRFLSIYILWDLGVMGIFDAVCYMAANGIMQRLEGAPEDKDMNVKILEMLVVEGQLKYSDRSYGQVWKLTFKGARTLGRSFWHGYLHEVVLRDDL